VIFFEGNFGNLGTDLSHAPSSFLAHPQEQLEVGLGAAALAAPFILPEIGAGLGIGGSIDAAAGGGLAADLGIGDIGAAASADVLGSTAADFGFLGGGGADVLAAGGESALGFGADTALTGDTGLSSFLADPSLGADGGIGADVTGDPAVSQFASPAASSGAGEAPAAAGPSATPAGFANTDAELAGATTGTAPAATAAPAAATGGGGVTGALGSALSSPWTKLALGAAPLALALGMGQQQLPTSAQQLQGQATALSQQGQVDLASARAGNLNAGQTAVIGSVKQDLTNQWRQTLFNQGVQDPSKDARWPQIEAAIDAEVTKQTAQLIQQNITNALAETGQASAALTSIANMQFQADQNFTNSLINATKSLGFAAGSGQTITLKAA